MKRLIYCLALLVATWHASSALAGDFAVIVNKANAAAIDKDTILKIYTGEKKRWDDGTSISAVDLPEDDAVRAAFSTGVLGKTVANIKALWSQLIFSGTAAPPKVLPSDDDVKKYVSGNKAAIGYIKPSDADDSVKVVAK
jgi:ABC-type phosphate transport system substrate-binding protein